MEPAEPDKDLTAALVAYSSGEPRAVNDLLRLVYERLHAMAADELKREGPGHTLQPTALVSEVYLRLADQRNTAWRSRAHFFAIAAQAMRRVLLDHARTRRSEKRGGGRRRVPLTGVDLPTPRSGSAGAAEVDLIALDDALGRLATDHGLSARIVEMRFFAGMEVEDIASVLDVTDRTVRRHWVFAKAWLARELARPDGAAERDP
ncbi:MAG: ECF-type sigma factor [Phycisphaerales bacterium]